MILILSDIHFGSSAREAERIKEAELLALLEKSATRTDAIYLLGDVFDQYVEYRHLVPKGFARFQGKLGQLTDAGIPVHYIVGNHDPWHLDYFERELGVRVHTSAVIVEAHGRKIVLSHGDEADSRAPLAWARVVARHPVATALFRTLIPADAAYRFTRWTKRRLGSDHIDMRSVSRLNRYAERLMANGADVVVLGHTHVPECVAKGDGMYVNAGSWHVDRSYVELAATSISIRRWNGEDVSVYAFGTAEIGRSPQ